MWVNDRLIFFHNRLAIIDPEPRRQPMADADGVITFNGEIYNLPSSAPGETYRLRSDTEVLLKGLNRQGSRFLDRTHCMFAFGYYNYRRSAELLLARDRFGIKQLYYIETDELFAFASTLKPLMMFSNGETDEDAVFDYYVNRAVKAPRTLFRDIRQLEAGHIASLRREAPPDSPASSAGGRRALSSAPRTTKRRSSEEVDRLLRRAVTYRWSPTFPSGFI